MDPSLFPHGLQFDLPQQKSGGMFGGGGGNKTMSIIAAMLNGFNAGMPGPGREAGLQGLQMLHQGLESKRKEHLDEQQRQQQLRDQMSLIDYRAAHKEPDEFTQMMQAAGIDPNSEAGRALYLQAVQNKANPFTQMRVQNPDGSESLQFMRPPQIPTAPVGKLTPFGGPTPPASGRFPGY